LIADSYRTQLLQDKLSKLTADHHSRRMPEGPSAFMVKRDSSDKENIIDIDELEAETHRMHA
jgi:hypothetical protein